MSVGKTRPPTFEEWAKEAKRLPKDTILKLWWEKIEECWKYQLSTECNGNAAKQREAIAKCVNLITEFGNAEIVKTPLDVIVDIEAILKAALAEPPRQCDVGTAEEQRARFDKFCRSNAWDEIDGAHCMSSCPLYHGDCSRCEELEWAQMPYDESEAGK